MSQTDAQKATEAEYRRNHPIPQGETAEQKATREANEKQEKANANQQTNPDRFGS